ncbi:hypothetical protein ANCDUO_00621, partial [Ancylostoma duodenale]
MLARNLTKPNGWFFHMLYDSRGRLRELTTPAAETHHFSATPYGSGRVVKRRIPFTKKSFVAAEDSEGRLLEWLTADEQHHVLKEYDQYGRVVKELCDGSATTYSYHGDHVSSVTSPQHLVNLTWQGPLPVSISERRMTRKGWRDSSFAVEYDELMRPTSVQAVIAGTAVEPIQLSYDDRTAFMSSFAGYQILRESTMVRIQGFKMMHETSLDAYRSPASLKIVIGDVRLSLVTTRDSAGRATMNMWRTINGEFAEKRTFDVQGRLANCEMNGKERYVLTESGIEKEIHRDPFGRVIADTQASLWIPLGYRGGVDIPELSVVIMPNSRPYDTVIGRYMSFGPAHIGRVRFDDITRSVDPFALEAIEVAPLIPTDLSSWFRLAGLSPSLLPSSDLHLSCHHSICARSLASFPTRLRVFSQLPSLPSSDLLDETFTAMYPSDDVTFAVEDAGFHELLVLTPNGRM